MVRIGLSSPRIIPHNSVAAQFYHYQNCVFVIGECAIKCDSLKQLSYTWGGGGELCMFLLKKIIQEELLLFAGIAPRRLQSILCALSSNRSVRKFKLGTKSGTSWICNRHLRNGSKTFPTFHASLQYLLT